MLFQDREPWSFADREKVLWPEVVCVINHLFERQTERALTAEQLGYLAERLMGKSVTCRLFLFKQLQSMEACCGPLARGHLIRLLGNLVTARKRSLGQGNVFRSICLSTGGSLYDFTFTLAVWSHVPSWGSLSLAPSPTETPPPPTAHLPPYGEEWAVRILLECFLVWYSTDPNWPL